jgi:hypothetical protein
MAMRAKSPNQMEQFSSTNPMRRLLMTRRIMTMNAGAVFTPPSNLPFQHFHFGRILYQIGHSVFPVETQRHFHEAMDGPVLIIRQPFGLVI